MADKGTADSKSQMESDTAGSDTQGESDIAVLETSVESPVNVKEDVDLSKVVFQIFAELEVTGKMVKFVAFEGNTEDWRKMEQTISELYNAIPAGDNMAEETADPRKTDDGDGSNEESKSELVSFSASRVLEKLALSVRNASSAAAQAEPPSKVTLWNCMESIQAICTLQLLFRCNSNFESGGHADSAFQFCEVMTRWYRRVYDDLDSRPQKNFVNLVPCLYMEVLDGWTLGMHRGSMNVDAIKFQLFVELEPSGEQIVAFEGDLDDWIKFLEEYEKQVTRLMNILERKDDTELTHSERWRLATHSKLENFLKEFSSTTVYAREAILDRRFTKFQFLNYAGLLKCTAYFFCALPWDWVDQSDVRNFQDALAAKEMLEVLQLSLLISMMRHAGQFFQMEVFLEALEVSK